MQLFEKTLGDWLEQWAEQTPDKEYIVYSDRNLRFTWKEFNERVDKMAKGLLAIGIKTHMWASGRQTFRTGSHFCMPVPKSVRSTLR